MTVIVHDLGVATNLEVIDRFLTPEGMFLVDAGCGDMNLSRELAARGAAVLAIDPDPVQAEKNRQASTIDNVGFAEVGAQAIPVENHSVDGVLFPYSLHHVPPSLYKAVFDEMSRILKPAGFLYIIEPVASGLLNDVMRLFHDEAIVRAAAQEAIDTYAQPTFQQTQIIEYRVPVQFESWGHFVENYGSKSYNANYSEQDVRSEAVRQRFEDNGKATHYRFETPIKVSYLSKPLASVPA